MCPWFSFLTRTLVGMIIPHIINHKENGDTKAVREMIFDRKPVGVLPYISHIKVCAVPKGKVFVLFWSENGYRLQPVLVWNRIWFSRKLGECMSVSSL